MGRGLHITPEMMERTYELLRLTPPFRGWNLPHADEIEFRAVNMRGQDQGYCQHLGTHHCIALATNKHSTLHSLTLTIAHEMVHLRMEHAHPKDRAHHGARFKRYADMVCRHHTFDRGQF